MKEGKSDDVALGGLLLLLFLLMVHGLGAIIAWEANLDVGNNIGYPDILKSDLTSFNKITLGIPISVNGESSKALTAIPGIGPKTAYLIVQERNKMGGFKRLEELKSVPGIGPVLYQKIKPYLDL